MYDELILEEYSAPTQANPINVELITPKLNLVSLKREFHVDDDGMNFPSVKLCILVCVYNSTQVQTGLMPTLLFSCKPNYVYLFFIIV